MFDKLQKVGDAANKYKDELPDFENQVRKLYQHYV